LLKTWMVANNLRTPDAASLAQIIRNIRLVAFDFDGVFTDNTVYVFEDGREAVRCTRSDGIGLSKLRALDIATVIISTEPNPVVSARSRKLNIECIQNCEDKVRALNQVVTRLGLFFFFKQKTAYEINDLACLTAVGLPIVVGDAHPDVVSV